MQPLEEFLEVRRPDVIVLVSKAEYLAGIHETYLRRESGRIERLGYSLDPAVKGAPYSEFTLRRRQPSTWRA